MLGMGSVLVSQSQSQSKIQKKYKRDWAKMKVYLAINNLATNPPDPRPNDACKKEIERVLKSQDLIRPIEVTDPSKSTGANFELSLERDDSKFTLDEGVTLEQCCELYKSSPTDTSNRCGVVRNLASIPPHTHPATAHTHATPAHTHATTAHTHATPAHDHPHNHPAPTHTHPGLSGGRNPPALPKIFTPTEFKPSPVVPGF